MSYYFKEGKFIIENYDKKKTFSSFLPGIAGIKGIPLWSFYANRAQAVTSFGIRDKNEPILEFFPANTAYQYVDKYGFRSFVRIDDEVFEPFSVSSVDDVKRIMEIDRQSVKIIEENKTRGIRYSVRYFGVPNEPFGALARIVNVEDTIGNQDIDIYDGIATILPSGASNGGYKEMSNLMRSWMNVYNMDKKVPFFRFNSSSGDEAEVQEVQKGHFYLSVKDGELVKPIVDQKLVFAHDTSLTIPFGLKTGKELDLDNQVTVNKVPCAFTPIKLNVHETSITINTLIGHVASQELINQKLDHILSKGFFEKKEKQSVEVIDNLVDKVETETSNPIFDEYIKQNLLDNVLRGGYPITFGEGEHKKVYHVFSRKHGDPERDYNFFSLSPEFYSQGNANFRDVNQNRRNDIFINPDAGIYNVKTFMNLIQLDGYNPLGVHGTTFTIDQKQARTILEKHDVESQSLLKVLEGKFTPGSVSTFIELNNITLKDEKKMLDDLLMAATHHIEANFGEGFWVDHFTYNVDLIENYLSVYPDRKDHFMFEDKDYIFFDSLVKVLPRSRKYGRTDDGKIRQYGSVSHDHSDPRLAHANWVTYESGEKYKTTLISKLFTLILVKFSTLDPFGMGIEMEANKPGWNDAMNGLPGVFASGVSESLEVIRLIDVAVGALETTNHESFVVLDEVLELAIGIKDVLAQDYSAFDRWDKMTTLRENYRDRVYSTSLDEKGITVNVVLDIFNQARKVLEEGILKAQKMNNGIIPTFMIYEVDEFELLKDDEGNNLKTDYGLDAIKAKKFTYVRVPDFLEAPARSLKVFNENQNRAQYELIKTTDIYDNDLQMYKTSEKLDEMSFELGRIRAFTPGWLERESNFLHMGYKYLLGLLKGGLVDEFYKEIQTNLVCFMDPSIYGRSTLENSSFIASSFNPDPELRGQGFVARLSGSTAEMLSIWNMMMFGKKIFTFNKELIFNPSPVLHSSFFKDGVVKTKLFGGINFIIENQTGYSTYEEGIEISEYIVDGNSYKEVKGQMANKIRERKVSEVKVIFKKV